jgi:type IV secretion system protein TrbL
MDPLQALLGAYSSTSQGWLGPAIDAGLSIFTRLAALELVVFGFVVALRARGAGAVAVLPELAWKLFLIALLMTALLIYPVWMPFIAPSFVDVAGSMTGFSTLNPVTVVSQGIALAVLILGTAIGKGLIFGDPLGALVGGVVALGILLAFIAMAAIMTRTLIESWIVLAGGPFFLGFAPFRLTATLADNFITYAFYVGIKLFLLILLIATANRVILDWALLIFSSPIYNFELLFELLAGAVILAVSLWTIPNQFAERLTRGWSLGLRGGFTEK